MKKYFFIVFAAILFSCSQHHGYKIKVKLKGAKGMALLTKVSDGSLVSMDTAVFENEMAMIEGQIDEPTACYLLLDGKSERLLLFLENTDMEIIGHADSIDFATIKGSALNDQYQTLINEAIKYSNKAMTFYGEAIEANEKGDTALAKKLMEYSANAYITSDSLQIDFIKNHPASYINPILLKDLKGFAEEKVIDELISGLDEKILQNPIMVQTIKEIKKSKMLAVGRIAPDFTQNDTEGNPVKFSDIYSQHKLTLLDFWASWCGPCRGENPNVRAVYKDFKDKGFTVMGFSLDNQKQAWLKSIKADDLIWTQVSNLTGWDNEVVDLYDVNAIPRGFLVDETGKIIAKDKRGEELRETVQKYLAQ